MLVTLLQRIFQHVPLFPGGPVGHPAVLSCYLISAIPPSCLSPLTRNVYSFQIHVVPLGLGRGVLFVSFSTNPENFMRCKSERCAWFTRLTSSRSSAITSLERRAWNQHKKTGQTGRRARHPLHGQLLVTDPASVSGVRPPLVLFEENLS